MDWLNPLLNWLVKQPAGFTVLVLIFSTVTFFLFKKFFFMKNHDNLMKEQKADLLNKYQKQIQDIDRKIRDINNRK